MKKYKFKIKVTKSWVASKYTAQQTLVAKKKRTTNLIWP